MNLDVNNTEEIDKATINELWNEWVKSDVGNDEVARSIDDIWYEMVTQHGGDHESAFEELSRKFITEHLKNASQSKLKRSSPALRRHNLMFKRANTNKAVGIDLVSTNANKHGSRAMRRKVSHDARKGTKLAPDGHGSVKLTDTDLVGRYGRVALDVISQERFDAALKTLNELGQRLDLKVQAAKTDFQKTVDALSDLMNRKVGV